MDFQFSEREEMLRKAVREFAENEVPPKMEAMEETGEFPVDLLKPMAEIGILGVTQIICDTFFTENHCFNTHHECGHWNLRFFS